jgi:hypothetical protein
VISYLGWVGAQITALGLVFNVVSGGEISQVPGMWIGADDHPDLHPVRRHVGGGRHRLPADDHHRHRHAVDRRRGQRQVGGASGWWSTMRRGRRASSNFFPAPTKEIIAFRRGG